jgi:adenosylcobinamide-GDP ribazoletransferase
MSDMPPAVSWLESRVEDIRTGLVFSTRLPLPWATGALAQAVWAFPVAGLVVGLIGALVYTLTLRLGLPASPAAALAVSATALATGCLHEDGLADTVDGFGGGTTREQKLAIMRDSRIGVYGVCALALSLLLRVAALASFADAHLAAWALVAAHGAARANLAGMMFLLPPARSDGLSFDAGRPSAESAGVAFVLALLTLALCLHIGRGTLAMIFLLLVLGVMSWLTTRQIGGQTGDVLGATEQIGEIVVLLVALG